jgi:hypothetical protein
MQSVPLSGRKFGLFLLWRLIVRIVSLAQASAEQPIGEM